MRYHFNSTLNTRFVSIERSLVYFAVCAIYGVMRCIVATATTKTTKTTTLSSISSISRYTYSTAIRMATEADLFFLATGFLCGMIWNSRFVINTLSQMINTFVRAYHHKGKHKTKTGWNVDICCADAVEVYTTNMSMINERKP